MNLSRVASRPITGSGALEPGLAARTLSHLHQSGSDEIKKGNQLIIKCSNCGQTEKTNKDFFVKVVGGAMPVGGFYAWVAYLFAGTGFALPICFSIITGGVGLLVFKDQIIRWLANRGYKCHGCGRSAWE